MAEEIKKLRVDTEITFADFVNAIEGEVFGIEDRKMKISGISTDSRQVVKGDAFFALKGERFDGHKYLNEALDKGAALCVFEGSGSNLRGLKVRNTTLALGSLAGYYRRKLKARVVAITGSNGKTTSKNMTASILSKAGKTNKSQGSYNNHVGLPLTILGTDPENQFLVLEIGMNHPGEIEMLTKIADPDVGAITNVGPVHLEFMKNVENVAEEKGRLFESLRENSFAVLNIDDEKVSALSNKIKGKKLTFSCKDEGADLFYRFTSSSDGAIELNIKTEKHEVQAKLPPGGSHNASNAALSATIGIALDIDKKVIKEGLEEFKNDSKRFEIVKLSGNTTLVNDCYNANPASVEAALKDVSKMKGIKYLVFADMLELGETSERSHEHIGELAQKLGFENILLMGNFAGFVESGALKEGAERRKVNIYKKHEDVVDALIGSDLKDAIILIKGSRGMRMEKIAQPLIEKMKD